MSNLHRLAAVAGGAVITAGLALGLSGTAFASTDSVLAVHASIGHNDYNNGDDNCGRCFRDYDGELVRYNNDGELVYCDEGDNDARDVNYNYNDRGRDRDLLRVIVRL